MNNKLAITLLATGVFLSGCGLLGPSYQQPQLNAPVNWAHAPIAITRAESVAAMAWWKKFNDPQLNQLIESALSNNNNLQIAIGNSLQAKAALSKIQMGWVPTMSLGAIGFTGQAFNPGYSNTSGNSMLNGGNLNNPQNFDGYAAGFIPSYSLNIFSQIKQQELAKLNVELQQQAINATRLTIISQVSVSYFNLLGLTEQLRLQQQLLHDAQELRRYNQIQYNSGSVAETNLVALDQYINDIQAKLPQLKNSLTQAENALQILTNNNPGTIKLQSTFAALKDQQIIPANLPSQVLKERPDVAIAEYQLQIANANIGAVTAQFFPTINLTGMLGQGSLQLSNLFNAGGDFWAAQVGAAMPLLNLGLYADIDKAKGGYYSAYYNYIQTVRNAFAQTDNALTTYNNWQEVSNHQNQALTNAKRLLTLAQNQYRMGASSYSDTLGYQLNIDYVLANLNQTKIEQLNALISVYQALGGGSLAESQLTTVKKFGDSHDI